jgi:hypothetical protein
MDPTFSDHHYGSDPFREASEEPVRLVVGVFPHPLHGRLVAQLIFWVRPQLEVMGLKYKLTWWGDGVAYYRPVSA